MMAYRRSRRRYSSSRSRPRRRGRTMSRFMAMKQRVGVRK